jgi:DNA-binding MarR family transcriptional regulator
MNKTILLVNEWGAFEAKYPDRHIEDFCRYYLSHQKEKESPGKLTGGVIPANPDALLLKIIGRIAKFISFYSNLALEGTTLKQIEEFGILLTIQREQRPRKTDIIYSNLFELSGGTDLLRRLHKRGLIKEYIDKNDRRSKRIELTPEGEQAIEAGKPRARKMAKMLLRDMPEDDKQLCIQLLKNTEIKFSALWQRHKGKKFDEVYEGLLPAE